MNGVTVVPDRVEEIEAYLAGRNGRRDELDAEMAEIVADAKRLGRVKAGVKQALNMAGEAGIPGIDRDKVEVSLMAEVGVDGKKRAVVVRPDGVRYLLRTVLWAEAMNRLWAKG